ncbi:MAG: ANTAR domain-containing protein [Acetatifactor sp.]|nr:ANTAR domain-containing protein [Acetatifactor sp.]
MGSIIIAMPKIDDSNRIAATIQNFGLALDIEICSSGAEVLRAVHDRDYGAVICTKKLRDMSYAELADYLPIYFRMVILTSDAALETFSDRMFKLMLPFRPGDLAATLDLALAGYYRRPKRKPLPQRSAVEKQIIDRAKAVLMDRNGMLEPEAFRYIQKNSMDCGRTMVESAQMILLMNKS